MKKRKDVGVAEGGTMTSVSVTTPPVMRSAGVMSKPGFQQAIPDEGSKVFSNAVMAFSSSNSNFATFHIPHLVCPNLVSSVPVPCYPVNTYNHSINALLLHECCSCAVTYEGARQTLGNQLKGNEKFHKSAVTSAQLTKATSLLQGPHHPKGSAISRCGQRPCVAVSQEPSLATPSNVVQDGCCTKFANLHISCHIVLQELLTPTNHSGGWKSERCSLIVLSSSATLRAAPVTLLLRHCCTCRGPALWRGSDTQQWLWLGHLGPVMIERKKLQGEENKSPSSTLVTSMYSSFRGSSSWSRMVSFLPPHLMASRVMVPQCQECQACPSPSQAARVEILH
ncbi:hypothetical protein E2C01_027598 [Portunus trituberculatus]|uniref:Uncharacterized protein n=1 Tax=Portunus trituberculatus TaxID=210409 RepID=A0A5B7ELA6_PORTR|nr:hypothetical protein [Portunus trituberculatus]